MKNRPQISHEVPLSLLEKSREFNDYDYALVHLCKEYSQYKQFFINSLRMGRKVILDNSIFELGEAFDAGEFAMFVESIQPTTYVVPDVLEGCDATIDNFENWCQEYSDLPGLKMGVVQGKTYEELVKCYTYMFLNADVIAISFNYSYYELTGLGHNVEQKWANGRSRLLLNLLQDNILDLNKPIHLLGCGLPQEFVAYCNVPFNIQSIDTSSPVVHGIRGIKYGDHGLQKKHMVKLADMFQEDITPENMDVVLYNVNKFRELVHGK